MRSLDLASWVSSSRQKIFTVPAKFFAVSTGQAFICLVFLIQEITLTDHASRQ
jgi:hypothetical protein